MTEHRIVSTQFTAYTAAVECSCGSTVSHLGRTARRSWRTGVGTRRSGARWTEQSGRVTRFGARRLFRAGHLVGDDEG